MLRKTIGLLFRRGLCKRSYSGATGLASGQRKLCGERSRRKTNVFGPPEWVGDLGMNQTFFFLLKNSAQCESQDGHLMAVTR